MSRDRAKSGVNTRDRGRKFVAQLRCAAWLPRCRGRHQPVAAAFPAQILGNFATAPGDEPHECADPSRGACTGVMSRRWLSTRGASGFAAHAARTLSQWWARLRSSHRRIRRGAAPRRRGRPSTCCRRRSRDEREPQEPSKDQAPKSGLSSGRDPPPVGGHRSGGQALPGWDPARLVSLVGWVCSGRAQYEAKKAAAALSVYSFDTPSSGPLKSWLVVARGASARLQHTEAAKMHTDAALCKFAKKHKSDTMDFG